MRALGVAVEDTIALVGGMSEMYAVSVADPVVPYLISTLTLQEACYGISIAGALAYVGTAATPSTSKLRVIDISDPESLRCVGFHIAPAAVLQVCRQDSLIYAACYNGGVCIFETTTTTSVAEIPPATTKPQAFELTPNPASSFVDIRLEVNRQNSIARTVVFHDAVGRVVLDVPIVLDRGKQSRSQRVDLSILPDGCYFVSVEPSGQGRTQKVIKFGNRR